MSEPFMPVAEMADDMLIDTGTETITWGELQRRKLIQQEPTMGLLEERAVSDLRKAESHPAYALMNEAARILSGYGEGADENDTDGEAAASEGRTAYVILNSGAEIGPFEEFNGFGKHAVYGRHASCRLADDEAWGEVWSHVILYDQIAAFRVVY